MNQSNHAAKWLAGLGGLAAFGLAQGAYAQSEVRIYGALDAGVAYSSNGAPGTGHTLSMASGILRPSMLGFTGMEDLGGGMQAVFRLEAGLDADTGAMKNYQGNPSAATPAAPGGATVNGLFNRRAFVGLSGHFGSLTLGRDYTPIYWSALDTDVLGLTLYGNLQESVALSGTGSDRYGRASNGLFYASPELHGVVLRAMYSFGSESGGGRGAAPSKANRMAGISGKFSYNGLVTTLVYQQIDLPKVGGTPLAFTGSTSTRKDMSAGAKYTFQRYALSAGYLRIEQPTVVNTDDSMVWLGATVPLQIGTMHASVQRLKQRTAAGPDQAGVVLGLAYIHPLSKRTSLYSSYGRVNNSATAVFPLVSADPAILPGAAGAHVRALALGVMHAF